MARREKKRVLIERARDLRRRSTFPESLPWKHLKARRLGGLHLRRQHPVGPFVVDFCCPAANLVVEVDGRSHIGQGESDQHRQKYIEGHGYRVLRFTNDPVLDETEAVVTEIARACGLDW